MRISAGAEIWDTQDSHKASLTLPSAREAIAKGKPLIASFDAHFETTLETTLDTQKRQDESGRTLESRSRSFVY